MKLKKKIAVMEDGTFEECTILIKDSCVEFIHDNCLVIKMEYSDFMFVASTIRAELNGKRKSKKT